MSNNGAVNTDKRDSYSNGGHYGKNYYYKSKYRKNTDTSEQDESGYSFRRYSDNRQFNKYKDYSRYSYNSYYNYSSRGSRNTGYSSNRDSVESRNSESYSYVSYELSSQDTYENYEKSKKSKVDIIEEKVTITQENHIKKEDLKDIEEEVLNEIPATIESVSKVTNENLINEKDSSGAKSVETNESSVVTPLVIDSGVGKTLATLDILASKEYIPNSSYNNNITINKNYFKKSSFDDVSSNPLSANINDMTSQINNFFNEKETNQNYFKNNLKNNFTSNYSSSNNNLENVNFSNITNGSTMNYTNYNINSISKNKFSTASATPASTLNNGLPPPYYPNPNKALNKANPNYQYASNNYVKTEGRPPLPYNSNSSTCPSLKEEFTFLNTNQINFNAANSSRAYYFEKTDRKYSSNVTNTINLNNISNNSSTTTTPVLNPKKKSFNASDNENMKQILLGSSGIPKKGSFYNSKNKYNKFNFAGENSENTEILTVKFTVDKGKELVMNVHRFDDLIRNAKEFCEKNKLPETYVKPVIKVVSDNIFRITNVISTDINLSDVEYLSSLSSFWDNKKDSEKVNIKEPTDEELNEMEITSISEFALNEELNNSEDDIDIQFYKMDRSF